jgi:DNA-binding PadR family transcriptional regulator
MTRETLRATIYYVRRNVAADPSLLVLAALMAEPKHGYALIEEIEAYTGRRLGPGTLYGAIARLEHARCIEPLETEDRGRRPYRITALGRRAYEEQLQSLQRYQRALKRLAAT